MARDLDSLVPIDPVLTYDEHFRALKKRRRLVSLLLGGVHELISLF
jgi:hypothetical protein